MAIASLILGIIGILTGLFLIGIIPSVIALIFSIIVLIMKKPRKGMAIAGMVTSLIGILLAVLIFGISLREVRRTGGQTVETQSEKIEEREEANNNEKENNFETGILWDGNGCIIYNKNKNELSFQIENNSDKNYNFNIHSMAINGVMTNCNIYTGSIDIPSGANGKMKIEIDDSWVERTDDIEYIDLVIWAYDKNSNFLDFETGIIRITTECYSEEKEFEPKEEYTETNGLFVFENSINENKISYSIINTNNYQVETDLQNCSINGQAFEPGYSTHITSDSIGASLDGYGIIVFPNSIANVVVKTDEFVEENKIEKIETFEFSLKITPNGDYTKQKDSDKIIFEK